MTKFYGKKYDGKLTRKEIAALVRKEIRAAYSKKRGYNISVRYRSFSGGSAIDVDVLRTPFNPLKDSPAHSHDLSQTGEQLIKELQAILNSYNYDGSDIMTDYFDVNFYGHASYDWRFLEEKFTVSQANKAVEGA